MDNAQPDAKAQEDIFVIDYSANGNDYKDAFNDLKNGLKHWRLWTLLAWHGLHQRYKRTWIGMGWIGLSFALFALVKIFIFGPMTGKDLAFYGPFLASGFLIFRLVSNFITNGTNVFVGAGNWIKSEPLPLSVHLYKLMTTNLITFAFAAIPAVIICMMFGRFYTLVLLSLPFALLVYSITGIFAAALIGIICTRYRDIMHFMTTVMQVMYFATPILWVPPETGLRAMAAQFNPLTHYLAIMREPLLNNTVPWHSWQVVAGCSAVLIITSFLVFAKVRSKLIYWL